MRTDTLSIMYLATWGRTRLRGSSSNSDKMSSAVDATLERFGGHLRRTTNSSGYCTVRQGDRSTGTRSRPSPLIDRLKAGRDRDTRRTTDTQQLLVIDQGMNERVRRRKLRYMCTVVIDAADRRSSAGSISVRCNPTTKASEP